VGRGGDGDDLLDGDQGDDTLLGGDGNDELIGGQGNDRLIGEGGNDRLSGEQGHDLLVGGDGGDVLIGGGGLDLVIGGSGHDELDGGTGDDVLVAGGTIFDGHLAALDAILAEWISPRSYPVRVQNLRNGTGSANRLNGSFFLSAGETVFDDECADSLDGGQGRDWYFADRDGLDGDDDELGSAGPDELVDPLPL
jgi:Ca2+-binding RTX toxin-like protein